MSSLNKTFEAIKQLVEANEIRISDHGYDELSNDDLTAREIVNGIKKGIAIEDYPNYPKGASVLVLQTDIDDKPIHVVWGIPKGKKSPAVLITAYKPDPLKWNRKFTERRK